MKVSVFKCVRCKQEFTVKNGQAVQCPSCKCTYAVKTGNRTEPTSLTVRHVELSSTVVDIPLIREPLIITLNPYQIARYIPVAGGEQCSVTE